MRKRIQLKDADICGKCFKELGFEKRDLLTASVYEYEKIKDGKTAYYANSIKERIRDSIPDMVSVKVTGAGAERDLVCTEEERAMFDWISEHFPDDDLRLVRVSENYVTVKRGEWDIVRMKFTNRAKWLMFPTYEIKQIKHRIERTAEIEDFEAIIQESIETAKKYED